DALHRTRRLITTSHSQPALAPSSPPPPLSPIAFTTLNSARPHQRKPYHNTLFGSSAPFAISKKGRLLRPVHYIMGVVPIFADIGGNYACSMGLRSEKWTTGKPEKPQNCMCIARVRRLHDDASHG
ncbi:hypothetical protein CLAIMM_03707, partial [Cladophialophora immunda]